MPLRYSLHYGKIAYAGARKPPLYAPNTDAAAA